NGVLLVVTHRRITDPNELLGASGGWHTHLDILNDVLVGKQPQPFWKVHTRLEEEYAKRFADDL
ncbi:MAG: ATPase, partial [Pseudomonadota bacterium]